MTNDQCPMSKGSCACVFKWRKGLPVPAWALELGHSLVIVSLVSGHFVFRSFIGHCVIGHWSFLFLLSTAHALAFIRTDFSDYEDRIGIFGRAGHLGAPVLD